MIELLPYLPFLLFALLVLGLICAGMAYKMKLLREEIAHLNALVSEKNKRLSLKEVAGSPEYGVLSDDLDRARMNATLAAIPSVDDEMIARMNATLAEFKKIPDFPGNFQVTHRRDDLERERPITR